MQHSQPSPNLDNVYRVQWRRPGCLAIPFYLAVAGATALAGYGITAAWGWSLSRWWLVPAAAAVFVALCQLHKLITRQHVPICPHCGVATNPQFQVCRACGRTKSV